MHGPGVFSGMTRPLTPDIVRRLGDIVGPDHVITDPNRLLVYESDGLTAYKTLPFVVVLPETMEQVSQVLRYCNENKVKVVPRGSGTSLSGGALPLGDAVLLVMSRFNQVLDIDFPICKHLIYTNYFFFPVNYS